MTNQNHDHDPKRLDRSLRLWLTEGRPPLVDREARISTVLDSLDDAPQTRARFLGRWFDRGDGARRRTDAHDHPPNTNRRNRLMLSTTGITAALAILALAVNSTAPTASDPAAVASKTHVVAADGSGDFETIGAAVENVSDGDTVLVRPGTYVEAFTIYQDITLAGDGPIDEIVIMAPADAPTASPGKFAFHGSPETYAVRLLDSDATINRLTFRGADTSVVVEGGSPTLHDLVFDEAGVPWSDPANQEGQHPVVIQSGSSATFQDNTIVGGAGIEIGDLSNPIIERNVLTGGATINGSAGDGTVIRDNRIADAPSYAILLSDPASVTLERNVIRGAGNSGIQVASTLDHVPTIRDNDISGVRYGIQVSGGTVGYQDDAAGLPLISDNRVAAELVAISVGESDAIVRENTVRESLNGIVAGAGFAEITGNDVEVSGYGIDVGAHSSATVEGNTVCGGQIAIKVHDLATPTIGENTTC